MQTATLNDTQTIIHKAIGLINSFGRTRYFAYVGPGTPSLPDTPEGYCPLGALAAVRTGHYGADVLSENIYEDTPDVVAVATALYEQARENDPSWTEEQFHAGASDYCGYVHLWNDETSDDAKIIAAMERAVEIAGGC
jgi:hypothetical protein